MAKPKGGTLSRLFEVSDDERKKFFERIQQRTQTTVVTVPPVVTEPPVVTAVVKHNLPTEPTVAKVTTVVPVKARSVQHAHTVWEQQLYDALWREGKPAAPEWKELSIGYRHIAALTGLALRTVQRNMKSLEEKLAIEPVGRYDPDTKTPKTYRIYSLKAILERRREAGLEWVLVNRQGVDLVRRPSLPTAATVPTVATVTTVGTETPADN
jgi:hypothetical protein